MHAVVWVVAAALAMPAADGSRPDPRDAADVPAVAWPDDRPAAIESRSDHVKSPPRERKTPPPRAATTSRPPIRVAVGLSPEAPGSKRERELLSRLERTVARSTDPRSTVRRLRIGAPEPRAICRERKEDLVIEIGYVPERDDPVVLTHDCRLDRALGIRSVSAIGEPGLVGVLWDEHEQLVRQGARERRPWVPMGPKARAALVAVGVTIVVGVAVGLLIAGALRDEKVVLTVSP